MTVELIVVLGCLIPLAMFIVAIFACELRVQSKCSEDKDI